MDELGNLSYVLLEEAYCVRVCEHEASRVLIHHGGNGLDGKSVLADVMRSYGAAFPVADLSDLAVLMSRKAREVRLEKKLAMKRVAKRAGISRRAYERFEFEGRMLSGRSLVLLEKVFGNLLEEAFVHPSGSILEVEKLAEKARSENGHAELSRLKRHYFPLVEWLS